MCGPVLNSESLQDLLDMKVYGMEDAYWPGTESDLIGIPHFPDVIYATVTDQTRQGHGNWFPSPRHQGSRCYKVIGGSWGGSSGRAKFAVACLALEDSLLHSRSLAILTDSKGLMTVGSNWVGEGKDPLLRDSPDRDILECIIKLLRTRVERGLFTIFVKIRNPLQGVP